MAKIMFILQRRPDQTHDQCMQYWGSAGHVSIVSKISGLTRWVQNRVVGAPGAPGVPACDGVGEIWFESEDALQRALKSPEMAAAVEDAKNFLDMDRTGMILVEEKTVLG